MRTYYVGLDVHKRHSYFVVMRHDGKIDTRRKVDTSESNLLGFVRSLRGRVELVVEETALTQWVYLTLHSKVAKLVVCKASSRSGPKTDFIDAAQLADDLRVNRLVAVYHSADRRMDLRTLVSGYDDTVQELVRTKNRYKALFARSALSTSTPKFFSDASRHKDLPTANGCFVGQGLFECIAVLQTQKQSYLERFDQNFKRFDEMPLLETIPGLGPVRINQIVAIMVTPERFASKHKLFSYSMLVKHKKESDGKFYGNKRSSAQATLHGIFKSAVVSNLRMRDSVFRRYYDEVRASGSNDKEARNAVARKIAAAVRAVWKSQKPFDEQLFEDNRKEKQPGRDSKRLPGTRESSNRQAIAEG